MQTFNKIARYGSGCSKDFRQVPLLPVDKPKSGFGIMNIIGDKNYFDVNYRYYNPEFGIWEEFRPVGGYEGYYEISNFGRLKSLKSKSSRGRIVIMVPDMSRNGYCSSTIKDKKVLLHRLVGQAFLDNPDNLPMINHEDGIKKNNFFTNLKWCTCSYNIQHSFDNGLELPTSGELHGQHKLKEIEVLEIASLIRENALTQEEIAAKFNVSRGAIKDIKRGKNWAYLKLQFNNQPNIGENNRGSLLKNDDIPIIRKMITEGKSNIEIGSIFGVHGATISDIRLNKTWKHIKI